MRRAHVPQVTLASRRRLLAWAGWATAAGFTILNLGLLTRNWNTPAPEGLGASEVEVITGLTYLGVASIGAATIARRQDNLVGWVFLGAGLTLAISAFASEYATYGVLTEPGSLPAVRFVAWLGSWGWWAGACTGLTFGLLLYPDGSLPSPRWRAAAVGAAVVIAVVTLLHAFAPGRLDGEYSVVVNPFGVGDGSVLRTLRDAAWVLVAICAVIAAAALVVKARTGPPERRRQLLWLAVLAAAAVVGAPLWGLSSGDEGRPSAAAQAVVLLVVFGTPIAVVSALARAAALRRSVDRLVLAREDERRRIRRDLHDGLGPSLAGVGLQLDAARSLVRRDPDGAEAVLEGLVATVKNVVGDVRRLVDDLRPPVLDQLGLASAIREGTSYLLRRGDQGELSVVVETSGNVDRLPPATEVTAFRIVMEAVTNASRHAHASSCVVHLSVDRALDLSIVDDGCGLPGDYVPGAGLESMRERAAQLGGSCTVEARPEGGTVVHARLPLGGTS